MTHPRGLVLAAVLLAAGCGQPTSTVHATPPPDTVAPATAAPTSAPATLTATPAPEPTDTDTGSPGTPPCATGDLKASRGITEVDGDDRTTEVVLVAAGTCSVDAFPTLLLEDAHSNILVAANPGGPGGIDLVGGVAYSSEVRLGNWCLGDPSYPVSIGIVHGIETLMVTGDSFPDEGDLPACLHQDADPVLSGTAWLPSP